MLIALHKNARTTPAPRAEMAASTESADALARRFGVATATAFKWKKRASAHDLPHTAHCLQTILSSAQERVAVELRRTLLMPPDDLLAVMREFVCETVSRSGLDRCLRRHGVGNLNGLKPVKPQEPHNNLQGVRAGLLAHGHQLFSSDGRRVQASLPVRGHRPGHALGVRGDQGGRRPRVLAAS